MSDELSKPGEPRVERSITMPIGVVVERRELDNRWQKWAWNAVAVIPGAPAVTEWREIARGARFVRYHAATLPLELHRKLTDTYRYNLSGQVPSVYVVLRRQSSGAHEYAPVRLTACPYEAQSYEIDGEAIVDAVPMTEGLIAWVQAFVDRHHVDRPFYKRQRKRNRDEMHAGGPRIDGTRRGYG